MRRINGVRRILKRFHRLYCNSIWPVDLWVFESCVSPTVRLEGVRPVPHALLPIKATIFPSFRLLSIPCHFCSNFPERKFFKNSTNLLNTLPFFPVFPCLLLSVLLVFTRLNSGPPVQHFTVSFLHPLVMTCFYLLCLFFLGSHFEISGHASV